MTIGEVQETERPNLPQSAFYAALVVAVCPIIITIIIIIVVVVVCFLLQHLLGDGGGEPGLSVFGEADQQLCLSTARSNK